ncbi:putative helicase, Zinc finger, RING-type, Zinc finger, RING/FYVE/PHD-type [Septoria linicola]|nr:putative helicase, Zinc finger, RING-type, Zinc finger, RING/FYVE/PHD-type [Septoria linicola]
MTTPTSDSLPTGDTNGGDIAPPNAEEQSSYMAADIFESGDGNFENFMQDIGDLEQYGQFPEDEEMPVAPQNVGDTEEVKSESGISDPLTPLESIKTEPFNPRTGIDEQMQNSETPEVNSPNLGTPSGLGDPISPELSPLNGHAPSQQELSPPVDLGNSMLERQRAKQQQLAAQFARPLASESEDAPLSPSYLAAISAELQETMPPPAPPMLSDIDLAEKYRKMKAMHDTKKKAGTMTTAFDIEYIKLQSQYHARQRKIAVDRMIDEEPSPEPESESALFVDQQDPNQIEYTSYDLDDDDEDERAVPQAARIRKRRFVDITDDDTMTTLSTMPSKATKPSKRGKKNAYTDADVDKVLAKVAAKNKGKGRAGQNRAGPKAGRGKQKGPQMSNMQSIFGTNIFKDTEQNRDLENQPNFHGTKRKADALKQLIASVPVENRKIATTDKRFLDEACRTFDGTGSVKANPDGNWTLKGMKSALKHYQVLGAAFMRKREHETVEPRGGILADEMGLGKTVMMLANIVNGKPQRGEPGCTLIVASPALCNQWAGEIRKHTLSKITEADKEHAKKHGLGRVVQHRAGHRLSSSDIEAKEAIEQANICLTTYQEICKSYPKAAVPANLVTAAQKDQWWKKFFEDKKGIFHHIRFHRVVLDEAQAIKNHKGHTSLACRAIKASHYWAITGTPIMNRLTEFYPYFKFLREPHTGSFKIFKENFCTPDDPDGTARLAVFLRKIMIRRTHLDTLFGARLLDLPQPKQTVVWLSFNETERQIYEIVKNRFIQKINTISKQEVGVANKYNHIWTMILRLRQLCAHILLIQGTIVELLEREDFEKLNALSDRHVSEDEGQTILTHLRHVLETSAAQNADTAEGGAGGVGTVIPVTETAAINAVDFANNPNNLAGGRHGLTYNIGKYVQNLAASKQFEEIQARSTCSACRQPPDNPHKTSCFHIYCWDCITQIQHAAARSGKPSATCGECGAEYDSVTPCVLNPEYRASPVDSLSDGENGIPTKSKGKKKKNKDDMDDWIGLKGEILPSTKTIACKAQVLEWMAQDRHCKIIIYTQFMPVIRIMEKVCRTERWNYVSYQGSMSQDARDKAIKRFDENVECNIMLMSLRCGGLGLNLTMAQHVILIDPWWNSAVEQQAFCRVFRIGQTKETRMTRFVVENTIDAAMMAMKERKEAEIDEVMENPRLKEKLSMDELLRMFGDVGHDENGHPFIFAETGEEDHECLREEDEDNEDILVNDF